LYWRGKKPVQQGGNAIYICEIQIATVLVRYVFFFLARILTLLITKIFIEMLR